MLDVHAQLSGQRSQQVRALSIVDVLGAFDELVNERQRVLARLYLQFLAASQGLITVRNERLGHRRDHDDQAGPMRRGSRDGRPRR